MTHHKDISNELLLKKIRYREILFGGNKRLKIYGTLNCRTGKKMKRENRIFFSSEEEAKLTGFRPCGHCMKLKYAEWKKTGN